MSCSSETRFIYVKFLVVIALLAAPIGQARAGALVTVNPDARGPGSSLQIAGSGFPPSRTVRMRNGGRRVGTARVDRHGSFALRVSLPGSKPGATLVSRVGKVRVVNHLRATADGAEVAAAGGARLRWSPTLVGPGGSIQLEASGLPRRARVELALLGKRSQARTTRRGTVRRDLSLPAAFSGPGYGSVRSGRLRLRFTFVAGTQPVEQPSPPAGPPQAPGPPGGSTERHLLAAVGDICSTDCTQGAATAATIRSLAPERVLGLGDYQYQNAGLGGVTFQAGFQKVWGDLAALTIPAFGATHDTCDGSGSWECYPVSFFGTAGAPEARGALSDNQWGYSLNIGTWHIVVFNYKSGDVAAVTADLDAHPSRCLLAVDHAPVYGSPTSEHPTNEASAYAATLGAHGVDLILNGHQHFYERNTVGAVTAITNGEGGIGHYTRTAVAPSAVAYDDTSFGALAVTLRENSWSTAFVPNAGAAAFADTASGGCGT